MEPQPDPSTEFLPRVTRVGLGRMRASRRWLHSMLGGVVTTAVLILSPWGGGEVAMDSRWTA